MDRTIINIVSLVLGGAGIFAALTEYSVPDLLDEYWDRNPFVVKAERIRHKNSIVFSGLAVFAVGLQVFAEIAGDELPGRTHSSCTYILVLLAVLLGALLIVSLLVRVARALARRKWLPEIVESQRESFEDAVAVIVNDGWRDDQMSLKDSVDDPAQYRDINFRNAEESIERIERLLEIEGQSGDLRLRATRLSAHFPAAVSGRLTSASS